MKVLVAYFSQTGNTAKVAQAIYEQVVAQGHKVELKTSSEVAAENLETYDLIFLGSACHDTDLATPIKGILDGISDSPPFKLAGFATHATFLPGDDPRKQELYETWASRCVLSFEQVSQQKQIEFLGYFGCQGAPSLPIEEFIHNTIITDDDEWETYIVELRKHPSEQDLRDARTFASEVLVKC